MVAPATPPTLPCVLSLMILIDTLKADWSLEMDGAEMYAALAERDHIPERRAIFRKLSALERSHAEQWAARIRDLGAEVPVSHSGLAHATRVADTPGGLQEIILAIEREERRDVHAYLQQMHTLDDPEARRILRDVVLDEFTHAHVLRRLCEQSSPHTVLSYLLRRKQQGTGSWIGDAIYGVNDGLGAIFGIVSGVSGATLGNSKVVLLAGAAGMVASALSMGAGAFLAAQSEREIYEAEMHREREAFDTNGAEARDELAVLFQLKGLPEDDAHKIAEHLAEKPDRFLKAMAAEKLNLTDDALSSPAASAAASALSTAVGAIIPVIPFAFMGGYAAIVTAALISLAAHFAVGAAKTLVTVRPWWRSGIEMTLVGAAEGLVTYLIGIGLGRLGA